MTIAFVNNNKAFLPEVGAYVDYFKSKGVRCEVVRAEGLKLIKPDVAWYFMGAYSKKMAGAVTIHEYTSASVKPFASVKDSIKRLSNAKPDYRIFLNEYVRSSFNFTDGVPFGFRDMGVPEHWLSQPNSVVKNRNTFIYVGELKNRDIEKLLDVFAIGSMRGYSLLILSKDYEQLQAKYQQYSNIQLEGPVPHDEIRGYICNADFAINFIPDKKPYNHQTSTKLLEYAACRTNIITTDYKWAREFGNNQFFYLKNDLSNFTPQAVNAFDYRFPALSEWTWQKQIERSGVVEFLAKKFPELNLISS